MTKTVAQKMGIQVNSRAFFINPDKEANNNTLLPSLEISIKLECCGFLGQKAESWVLI